MGEGSGTLLVASELLATGGLDLLCSVGGLGLSAGPGVGSEAGSKVVSGANLGAGFRLS